MKQYSWCCGRKLKSFNDTVTGNSINYEYDVNGLLLKKTNGESITEYYYEDGFVSVNNF